MKSILVLGTGGREYAIVKRLREDSININGDIPSAFVNNCKEITVEKNKSSRIWIDIKETK